MAIFEQFQKQASTLRFGDIITYNGETQKRAVLSVRPYPHSESVVIKSGLSGERIVPNIRLIDCYRQLTFAEAKKLVPDSEPPF